MTVGALDPVFTPARMERLRQGIRGCPPAMVVSQGGPFVQEHGAAIAREALRQLAWSRPRSGRPGAAAYPSVSISRISSRVRGSTELM
jgi:hypothetical protein